MERITTINDLIIIAADFSNPLFLVGAGNNGKEIYDFLRDNDLSVAGIVDQCDRKWESEVRILSYHELVKQRGVFFITTAVPIYRDQMVCQLKEKGVEDKQIYFVDETLMGELYEKKYCLDQYLSKVGRFKNKHLGGNCFVIGNGPSLSAEDLDMIVDVPSFGLNYIYAMYTTTKWRATYYGTYDHNFPRLMWKDKSELMRMLQLHDAVFTSYRCPEAFVHRDDPSMENLFFLRFKELEDEENYDEIDCANNIWGGGTSLMPNIQLAMYMGFKNIYLLGVDMGVKNTNEGVMAHNESINKIWKKSVPKEDMIINKGAFEKSIDSQIRMFEFLKEYAHRHQINIYNATRGGYLEVFPRVRLDDVVRKM